jgi:hypothetical protein
MGNFGGLNRDTIQSLQTMLHACNPYASIYQTAMERLQGGAIELSLRLVNDPPLICGVTMRQLLMKLVH